ncbi:MAG: hypothetical protein HC822_02165 [Oscillochloris sp.]|nr:hypothetical protein [Oscillochloris sp.]
MNVDQELEALRAEIAELRVEQARLQQIVAAAQEAHAFYEGRRPGFAFSYPRDVLHAVFAPEALKTRRPAKRPAPRKPRPNR